MADIVLPTLSVVLGTALIDAINPCAIGVLVLLISTLIGLSDNKRKLLSVGFIYILAVFLTYLAAGFGLLLFIQKLHLGYILSLVVGILVLVLGLIEIKDFFWYGKGVSLQISGKHAKKIQQYVKKVTLPGSIFLGIFVAAVELPCTGGPYLAITTLLAKMGLSWNVFWLLFIYNLVFVLPLIIIVLLTYFGLNVKKVQDWKQKKKKWMRLVTGLVLLALGIVLILWALGTISLSLAI
ncbi:MAG: GAP family protein [Nanoarchaeota archaeon]|nr:GAP family protein [Nanoarchaeota archaeon]